MIYVASGIISANNDPDFNTLVADINEVVSDSHFGETTEGVANFGYGETIDPALAVVSPGDSITAVQWTALFDKMHSCASHQGISVGDVPASVSTGDTITAFDGGTGVITILNNLVSNRLGIAGANATITSNGTKLTSQRTTAWNSDRTHEFTVTFTSYDAARHYFNTGGQIRFAGDRTGGTANTTNTNWTQLLIDIGTVIFDHTSTSASAGTGTAIGFYNLTDTYQTIFTKGVVGYAGDQLLIEAKSDATFGTTGVLRFRLTYSTSGTADGTLNSDIDEKRSTGEFVITAPVYATTIALSA